MAMRKSRLMVLAGVLIAASGAAVFATLVIPAQEASAARDPRQEPPMVSLVTAARVSGSERGFTGTVGARVESNLGFRVAGKIVERLVNVGEQVKAGQPLMRIDDTDLRLALSAKRNAVAAARAAVAQLPAPGWRSGCGRWMMATAPAAAHAAAVCQRDFRRRCGRPEPSLQNCPVPRSSGGTRPAGDRLMPAQHIGVFLRHLDARRLHEVDRDQAGDIGNRIAV